MFTGLIKDVGRIQNIVTNTEGKVFTIKTKLTKNIAIDDSVATNGVCLTATKVSEDTFTAQAVAVTLQKTTLGKLKVGDPVNLELALRLMDRLGGHLVQGHVGGVGSLRSIKKLGDNYEMAFSCDPKLFRYFIAEGSIALDGISLTLARVEESQFTVSIIPHTFENTSLGIKKIGDLVNIEVDMMAKYLENFMRFDKKFSLDKWFKKASEENVKHN